MTSYIFKVALKTVSSNLVICLFPQVRPSSFPDLSIQFSSWPTFSPIVFGHIPQHCGGGRGLTLPPSRGDRPFWLGCRLNVLLPLGRMVDAVTPVWPLSPLCGTIVCLQQLPENVLIKHLKSAVTLATQTAFHLAFTTTPRDRSYYLAKTKELTRVWYTEAAEHSHLIKSQTLSFKMG